MENKIGLILKKIATSIVLLTVVICFIPLFIIKGVAEAFYSIIKSLYDGYARIWKE